MTETVTARVARVMPATPEAVFDEWLDPESLADWMCPRPDKCVAVTVEPRVGGKVRFDVDHAGTLVIISGQFLDIDRPRLLRFTWANSDWPDPTASSIVAVTFELHGQDETLMSIEHTLLPSDVYRDFQNGWAGVCDQLEEYLTR
ncbi:MAG: SRPBCC domain-containing protein [Mycolicibacterium cosmeticum]|nr:SRPBCC domain-containing protein [Mycolicibacterium cosmeticum]